MTGPDPEESALYLSEDDLEGITFADAIDVVEAAFRDWAQGGAGNLPRRRLATGQSIFNLMAGATSDGFVGLKAYTVSARGAPMHMVLYAADGSGLRAVLAGGRLSLLRTGAASGVSARYLAPPGTDSVGVIGTGGQAMAQVAGIVAATGARKVKVYSRCEARRRSFADRVAGELGVTAEAVGSAPAAATDVGVLVTITNSPEPVLRAEEVDWGVHLIAAGNNNPARAEIEPALIARCEAIVVDDVDQALTECGELIQACGTGLVEREQLIPLADLVVRKAAGRKSPGGLTLFESQGIGLEDVAIAAHAYRIARQAGRGLVLR